MFDNITPYNVQSQIRNGERIYMVTFRDGRGVLQEIEVSSEVAEELYSFIKKERNLQRWDERHRERFLLSDESIYNRIYDSSGGVEEIMIHKELAAYLQQVIDDLPQKQRRRFFFYFEENMTYEQIAVLENCTKQSVKESVDRAREKVKEKIKKYFE